MAERPERDWERLQALERLWLDPDWDTIWGYRERAEQASPGNGREAEPE